MSRAAHAKTAFTSGVLGPRVSRRVDTQHFFNGAQTLENWIVLPWGGIERTPGTVFVQEVRDSSKPARLLDFIFNRRQAYILQLNDSKIRFYKNNGIIAGGGVGTAISAITNANPGVVTATGHTLSNGDIITMSGVDGMDEVNGVEYRVQNVSGADFSLSTLAGVDVDTTSYGTFIPSSATVLLLHLNSDFTDSSGTTAHTVTAHGAAAIATAYSKFGGGSCVFNGGGDYLSVPGDADFDFSGGVWAVDTWIITGDLSAARTVWSQRTDANNYIHLYIDTTGQPVFQIYAAGVKVVEVLGAVGHIALGIQHHIAVVENGDAYAIFVNGALSGSSSDANRPGNYTGTFQIGTLNGGTNPFVGYIDEFRVTNGSVRYASSIDAYTKLLLHGEGSAPIDSSPSAHTLTAIGHTAPSSTQKVFGDESLAFDGTGDGVSAADHADWNLGSGDFTLEGRFYFSNIATNPKTLICHWTATGNQRGFLLEWNDGGYLQLYYSVDGTAVSYARCTWTPTVNTWYHIEVTRSTNTLYFLVNGVLLGTADVTGVTIHDSTDSLFIGIYSDSTANPFAGYMDEVRISKGIARHTTDFSLPATAYLDFDVPTAEGPYSAVVDGIYEIAHSYADDELFDIQTAQSADIEYLFHADHPVMKLSRYADANWTLEEVDWEDGPYLDENTTATTLDPTGTSGSVTVTASAATGINDGDGFQSTDVGRLLHFYDGTNYGWLKITAVTNTTTVTATVKGCNGVIGASLGGHAASAKWALGAWSETTGYPRTGTFHQGRLYAASTATQPQHVWGSYVQDYENMRAGSSDSDALIIPIATDRVNLINWIASEKRLVCGTSQEIFTIYSGALNAPITPDNVQVDPESSFSASTVPPEKIGSSLCYMEGDDRRLREFSYVFQNDRYISVNKSILSDHATESGITEMAYQQSPYGILYCLRSDGSLATFTRETDQQIEAWTIQTPSGTSAKYKSVAVIPVDGYDEVWFIVERTINGSTKQYVEYQINPRQQEEADLADMVLMQSCLQYDDSPVSSVAGLDHLEGETVLAICDGEEVTGVVSSGILALGDSYSTVSVGLQVTSKCKLLPPEAASAIGSAQGLEKRINEVLISVYRSLGLESGEEGGNMENVFKDGSGAALTTLQTDDFIVPSTIGWDRKNELYFECDGVFPCTIILLVLYLWTSEK